MVCIGCCLLCHLQVYVERLPLFPVDLLIPANGVILGFKRLPDPITHLLLTITGSKNWRIYLPTYIPTYLSLLCLRSVEIPISVIQITSMSSGSLHRHSATEFVAQGFYPCLLLTYYEYLKKMLYAVLKLQTSQVSGLLCIEVAWQTRKRCLNLSQ